MMGYQPRVIPIDNPTTHVPAAEECLEALKKVQSEVEATLELLQRRMAQKDKGNQLMFVIGNKVWLENMHLRTGYPHWKLTPKQEGPFVILAKVRSSVYRLQLPQQWKTHPVFHASLLTLYKGMEIHGPSHVKPPADLIDGQEEFKVKVIINHKGTGS